MGPLYECPMGYDTKKEYCIAMGTGRVLTDAIDAVEHTVVLLYNAVNMAINSVDL